jgi:hypothetical protein
MGAPCLWRKRLACVQPIGKPRLALLLSIKAPSVRHVYRGLS